MNHSPEFFNLIDRQKQQMIGSLDGLEAMEAVVKMLCWQYLLTRSAWIYLTQHHNPTPANSST